MTRSVFLPALAVLTLSLAAAPLLSTARSGAAAPAPAPEPAGPGSYKVDAGHSSVLFRIKHLDTAWNFGRFDRFEGEFTLAEDPAESSVRVRIEAASVNTNSEQRDDHVRSDDFLNVKQFPDIVLTSTGVSSKDGKTYTVEADLEFHGEKKPVTFEMEMTGSSEHERMGTRVGFLGELTLKRSDFGMDKMLNMLSDEVHLILAVEAVKQ